MRQELRMSQQLVMTPQLQQAIKLLQLSRMELTDLVRSELLENPMLEEASELGSTQEEHAESVEMQDGVELQDSSVSGAEKAEQQAVEREQPEVKADERPADQDFDWQNYLQEQSLSASAPSGAIRRDDELPGLEQTASRPETLVDHLMWQVRLSDYSESDEDLAEFIIRSLGGTGYLDGTSLPEMARRFGCSTLRIEQMLRRVQALDPPAIGARNLAEGLWIQAQQPDDAIEDPLVLAIIAKHLPNLERRNYQAISRDTGEALEEVYEATKVIMALEPRPARDFATEEPQYVTPDVYVHKIGEEFVVSLNDDGLPKLKISNFYRAAMLADDKKKEKKTGQAGEAKDYIAERLRSAQWLIRSIQQRQRTILKVTRSILKFQREFFEKGPQHLRPLILKDVAEDIEMHESTVSRVTTNKYVHTPQGIFELKYFFNAGISRHNGGELASEAVKQKIRKLIEAEEPRKPYSDQKLVELLAGEGIDIARRTVAKYREQLGVLSSSKRKKLF